MRATAWIGIVALWFLSITLTLFIMLQFQEPLRAEEERNKEFQIKSAFIYRFMLFTTWPKEIWQDTKQELQVCVASSPVFLKTIKAMETKKVKEHTIAIKPITMRSDIRSCHVLFINEAYEKRTIRLLDQARYLPILTITDSAKGFDLPGIVIALTNKNNRLRFYIDATQAKSRRMTISSKLLELADRVIF